MALKKVLDASKSTYLNTRFEDDELNQYGDVAAKSLVAWYRFSDYEPGTVIPASQISDGTRYVIVTLGDTNNWQAISDETITAAVGQVFTASATGATVTGGGVHGTVAPLINPKNLSNNKFYDDESTPALIDVGATYGASAAAPALSTD